MELRNGKIVSPRSKFADTATDTTHKEDEEKKKNEDATINSQIENDVFGNCPTVPFLTLASS